MNQNYHQNQMQQPSISGNYIGNGIPVKSAHHLLQSIKKEELRTSSTPTVLGEAIDSWANSHAVNCINNNNKNMNPLSAEAPIVVAESLHNNISVNSTEKPGLTETNEHLDYVYDMMDQSVVCDRHGRPVTVGRMLATKPLSTELQTRPGPGGKKLVYLSGDTVTRSLNEIFGFNGWNLQICKTEQVLCINTKEPKATTNQSNTKSTVTNATATTNVTQQQQAPMWHVAYLSHVRITLTKSGAYREDLGAGDSLDRNLATAIQHAIKASITDAMKRAARHFGDKLGNSLYQGTFRLSNAPKSLHDALEQYDTQQQAIHHKAKGPSMVPIPNTNNPTINPCIPSIKCDPYQSDNVVKNSTMYPNVTTSCQAFAHDPYANKAIVQANDVNSNMVQTSSICIMPPINLPVPVNSNIDGQHLKPPMTALKGFQQSFVVNENIHNQESIRLDNKQYTSNTSVPNKMSSVPIRPQTSNGRRKSNPTLQDNTQTNNIQVVVKKSKLNPYST